MAHLENKAMKRKLSTLADQIIDDQVNQGNEKKTTLGEPGEPISLIPLSLMPLSVDDHNNQDNHQDNEEKEKKTPLVSEPGESISIIALLNNDISMDKDKEEERAQTKIKRRVTMNSSVHIQESLKHSLKQTLNLETIDVPLIMTNASCENDQLSGGADSKGIVFQPLCFQSSNNPVDQAGCSIAQSLAKHKRIVSFSLGYVPDEEDVAESVGIIAHGIFGRNMENSISNRNPLHSITVVQFEMEKSITRNQRNFVTLKYFNMGMYNALLRTEQSFTDFLIKNYKKKYTFKQFLPSDPTVVHTQDLLYRYPNLSPKERENIVTEEHGAIILIGIGAKLSNGLPHDDRSSDYDSSLENSWNKSEMDSFGWDEKIQESKSKYLGLNADLLAWSPKLKRAVELSSNGIRVDGATLDKQLTYYKNDDRRQYNYHQNILKDAWGYTVGGGLGVHRAVLLFMAEVPELNIDHIGQVQVSAWPSSMIQERIINKQGPLLGTEKDL